MPKIPEYPNLAAPNNNDLLVIEDSLAANTKNITREDFLSGTPLPANTVDTQAIADEAVTTAKRSGGFVIGTIPGSTFGTTGNKTITGVGFTPKLVRFYLASPSAATSARIMQGGMDESGTQWVTTSAHTSGSVSGNTSTSRCILFINAGSTTFAMSAGYVSMNADGFTIEVFNANSTIDVYYEAYA